MERSREVWDVILHNEEGTPVLYDVYAESHYIAICEAWRQYREVPDFDGKFPPAWAKPIYQHARDRVNGARPWINPDGTLGNLYEDAYTLNEHGGWESIYDIRRRERQRT